MLIQITPNSIKHRQACITILRRLLWLGLYTRMHRTQHTYVYPYMRTQARPSQFASRVYPIHPFMIEAFTSLLKCWLTIYMMITNLIITASPRKGLKQIGFEDWLIDAVIEGFNYFITGGYGSQRTTVVEQVTGRRPILFAQFAKDYADSFK